jgi:hypothetical protein
MLWMMGLAYGAVTAAAAAPLATINSDGGMWRSSGLPMPKMVIDVVVRPAHDSAAKFLANAAALPPIILRGGKDNGQRR